MIDLRTGRYTLTVRAPRDVCNKVGLERPTETGKLAGESLARLRAAHSRVLMKGFENPACLDGGKPKDFIITNAGTPIVVLATGIDTGSAPDDFSCWSEAASALHDALEDAFDARNWR